MPRYRRPKMLRVKGFYGEDIELWSAPDELNRGHDHLIMRMNGRDVNYGHLYMNDRARIVIDVHNPYWVGRVLAPGPLGGEEDGGEVSREAV